MPCYAGTGTPIRSRVKYTCSISQLGSPFPWVRLSPTLSLHTEETNDGSSDLLLHSMFEAVLPCHAFSPHPTCISHEKVVPLRGHSGVYRRAYTDVDEKMGPLDLARLPRRSRCLNRPDRTRVSRPCITTFCHSRVITRMFLRRFALTTSGAPYLENLVGISVRTADVQHATVRSGDTGSYFNPGGMQRAAHSCIL
jgi:hypothetical protein